MAIIKCPECGQDISDKAENCIHCGYPIKQYLESSKIQNLKENQVCNINHNPVDFSDITPYLTESCDTDIMIKILLKLRDMEQRIGLLDELELTKYIMTQHVIPKEYAADTYDQFLEKLANKLQNNTHCLIHKTTTYDLSPVKEYLKSHSGCSIKLMGMIKKIPELTKRDATYLIDFINKNHIIPICYPEKYDDVVIEEYIKEIDQYWIQKHNPNQAIEPQIQMSTNKPSCPNCGSTNIKKIGFASRAVGIMAVGLLSSSIGKTFKCNNCGYKW